MDTRPRRYCVYLHLKPGTQEVFYVGKAVGRSHRYGYGGRGEFDRPYNFGANKSQRNVLWRRLVNKYGPPEVEMIGIFYDEQQALLKERELIVAYGRRNLKTGPLANLSWGGEGPSGYVPTEETKVKHRAKMLGRKWTPEQIERRRQGQLGITFSAESRANMARHCHLNKRAVDLESGIVFHSAIAAARNLGLTKQSTLFLGMKLPLRICRKLGRPAGIRFADEFEYH
jgi:hypothetical protein